MFKINEKSKKLLLVPILGIVTKVGKKVPIMLPMVFAAYILPAVFPAFSKSVTPFLTKYGDTIPRPINGTEKRTRQDIAVPVTSKSLGKNNARRPMIAVITYLPIKGITATHKAAAQIIMYSLFRLLFLSADLPPSMFPILSEIIMRPIITVHIIWEVPKVGASSLEILSSTAITDIPQKNEVAYKSIFLSMSFFLSFQINVIFYSDA